MGWGKKKKNEIKQKKDVRLFTGPEESLREKRHSGHKEYKLE